MNLWNKPNLLAIIFLCIISLFAINDLQIPGLYTSHDGETHTARIAQYYEAIKDGQFPPRYAGSFYNGFGSPIFVYIYPLPYMFGSLLHLIGFSYVGSFKVVMGLGFALSGVFTYYWIKQLLGNTQAAIIGAMYYMYSPYRLQLIYVRGSISELLAYTFLPLALYSVTKLNQSFSKKQLVFCALAISGILLSQNLVALLTLPLILGYALVLSINSKSLRTIQHALVSTTWALALSAFTYFPAILERKFVKFDEVFVFFGSHFVTLKQIVRSPWGYGFDLPGTINDQMSFSIGLAHWLILLFPILGLLFYLIQKHVIRQKNVRYFSKQNSLILLSYLAIITCMFLVNENQLTKYIWENFSLLQIIDIPWRMLGLIPVFAALIGAIFVTRYRIGLIFLVFIFAVVFANRNHVHINKALPYTDEWFTNYEGTATQYSEFTPAQRGSSSPPTFTQKDLPVNTAGGWAKYTNINKSSRKITFNVTVLSQTAQIRVNKFIFPGVQIKAYNENMTTKPILTGSANGPVRLDTMQDTKGFIYFPLDKGTYDIEIVFGETPLRYLANLISVGALASMAYVLTRNVKKV